LKALAVCPGERAVRVIARDPPTIVAPHDVHLRVLEVGICGTDREICRFELGTPPAGAEHLVLGHECLAEVLEVGPSVPTLAPGDLVVPAVRRPCPHPGCVPCRSGRQDFCRSGDFVEHGIKGHHGFLAEELAEDARWLHRVPAALRHVAVLVEPLSVVEKALAQVLALEQRLDRTGSGRTALVTGAGAVGLLSALTFAGAGFETTVWSSEPDTDPRAGWLESLGIAYVPAAREPLAALGRRPDNVDVLIEATGAPPVAFQALDVLGHNGALVLFGLPGGRLPIEIDAAGFVRTLVLRNQLVVGTINAGPDAFEAAIRDMGAFEARWPGALRRLVTSRWTLDDAPGVLRGPLQGIKHVVALA
jgi:threonine dehydrogenase-like Zn-dependent dehydrogenase